MRIWMRSNCSRHVHSWSALSTSSTQFGGIQVTGGGKRSTPRTVAVAYQLSRNRKLRSLNCNLPPGNMSATSLATRSAEQIYTVERWCRLLHSPGAFPSTQVKDLLWVLSNGSSEKRIIPISFEYKCYQMPIVVKARPKIFGMK